jgi:hypothetical protein
MLLEPQMVNKARLYSLELRLGEVEDERQKGASFFKDTMKKLIYAIEQNLLNKQDKLISNNKEKDLPKLMGSTHKS